MILEGSFLATIVKMSDKLKRVTTPNPAPTSAHELANDLATAFRGYPAGVAILTTMGAAGPEGLTVSSLGRCQSSRLLCRCRWVMVRRPWPP